MEEALPEVEGDEAALAELEGDGVAATVGDGVGGTGSARYHSWKCPVWPCGAKYASALPSGDQAGEA